MAAANDKKEKAPITGSIGRRRRAPARAWGKSTSLSPSARRDWARGAGWDGATGQGERDGTELGIYWRREAARDAGVGAGAGARAQALGSGACGWPAQSDSAQHAARRATQEVERHCSQQRDASFREYTGLWRLAQPCEGNRACGKARRCLDDFPDQVELQCFTRGISYRYPRGWSAGTPESRRKSGLTSLTRGGERAKSTGWKSSRREPRQGGDATLGYAVPRSPTRIKNHSNTKFTLVYDSDDLRANSEQAEGTEVNSPIPGQEESGSRQFLGPLYSDGGVSAEIQISLAPEYF
ncbi:hypothetical protein C8R46DRAFT_1029156 [Mycena filopes]|nr:hypothetical protein C8R46DRAFT_1029156 [Mycena filopes]